MRYSSVFTTRPIVPNLAPLEPTRIMSREEIDLLLERKRTLVEVPPERPTVPRLAAVDGSRKPAE